MTDKDFSELTQLDKLLEEGFDLPPSEAITEAVTPWRRSMNYLLWGLGLVTVTLNFSNLDTILPAIGVLLTVLGCRALRRENIWFRAGYVLSMLRIVWLITHVFLNATVYGSALNSSAPNRIATYFMFAAGFFQLVCLRGGIRAVQVKAGLMPHTGSATAMLVWYTVMAFLCVINFSGFTVWLLLITYLGILWGLYKLSKELDEAGYAIAAAPVRWSDRTVTALYAAILAALLAVGYLCFSQYPMKWSVQAEAGSETAQTRQTLLELGFPEYVLDDLTDADILACDGAVKVVVDIQDYAENGSSVRPISDGTLLYGAAGFNPKLRVTGVAVELSGQQDNWMLFHHFLWLEAPDYRGTEALQFWPAYRLDGVSKGTGFSGQVLYDKDGVTFASDYYHLSESTYAYDSMFWGQTTTTDGFAAFSLPKQGENCRGYVCYGIRFSTPGYIIDSWCNYYYQESPLQYPVKTAEDVARSGVFPSHTAFGLEQTALQLSYDAAEAEKTGIYNYQLIDTLSD